MKSRALKTVALVFSIVAILLNASYSRADTEVEFTLVILPAPATQLLTLDSSDLTTIYADKSGTLVN